MFRLFRILLLLPALVFGTPRKGNDSVFVVLPSSLSKELGNIAASSALFGAFFYGSEVNGPAFLASDASNHACAPKSLKPPVSGDDSDFQPFVLLANRGNCSFVRKAKNAQDIGAAGLVIVSDDERTPLMGVDADESALSQQVKIPVLLVPRSQGRAMMQTAAVTGKSKLLLSLRVKLPQLDANGKSMPMALYTRVSDPLATAFKHNFRTAINALGDSVRFTPHYVLDKPHTEKADKSGCTNNGRYCSSSRAEVEETARQLCVFELFGTSKWWIYVEQFEINCVVPRSVNKECSDKVLGLTGLSSDQISKCVEKNGGFDSNSNVLLEKQLNDPRNLHYTPVLLSNNVVFESELMCVAPISLTSCPPLKFFCLMFSDTHRPTACLTSSSCPLGQVVDACGTCKPFNSVDFEHDPNKCVVSQETETGHFTTFIVLLSIVLLISFAIFVLFERRKRATMRADINRIMANYTAIEDNDDLNVGQEKRTNPSSPLAA